MGNTDSYLLPAHSVWQRQAHGRVIEKHKAKDYKGNILIGGPSDRVQVEVDGFLYLLENVRYEEYGQAQGCTCHRRQDHYETLWNLSDGNTSWWPPTSLTLLGGASAILILSGCVLLSRGFKSQ
jgi:hypothetical protein